MEAKEFKSTAPGRLVPVTLYESDATGHRSPLVCRAFVPDELPPALDWRAIVADHYAPLERAALALGRLNGLHRRVGNAAHLLRALWMREAKQSSEIEDIHTTAEQMVFAGAGRALDVRAGGKESWNYVQALEHGLRSDLPLTGRLLKEMHAVLMDGVRGEDRRPAQFRDAGVYIGDHESGPRRARFVPPPPGQVLNDALAALERFINGPPAMIPPLVRVALAHYQFETIHPFRDGNGRIGRVLASLSLVREGLLDHPVVYLSAFINRNRRRYVDLLLDVSQSGGTAWDEWIGFMIEAVETQAHDAANRTEALIAIRERFQRHVQAVDGPVRLLTLIDRLFTMPAINAGEAEALLDVSRPTVYKDLELMESIGILSEVTGKPVNRDWVCREILSVIEADELPGNGGRSEAADPSAPEA
ncbi:MAG: Fic family protein [Phycisphaerales bacterium]|nr:Fic family protein [Phycisphaerales bacterium]MCB9840706.1 Fic family protein [Phycisphaeraceae bacterium]